MKRLILGVTAALVLSASPALAEGLTPGSRISAGPMTPVWTGFYIGAGIGAGSVNNDLSAAAGRRDCYGNCDELTEFFGIDGLGGEGVFGTVSIGFDKQLGRRWVAGVFADYDFGSDKSSDAFLDVGFAGVSGSIDQNHTWSVGGRLGYLINPSTLLYGTAGYTQTEFEGSVTPHVLGFGKTFSDSQTTDGYFVGAGLETMLRSNWSLKLEYRYAQFDDVNWIDEECFNLTTEPSQHSARLVLSYKFGGRNDYGSIKD